MSNFVYVTNLPSGGPGKATDPCPYEHRGCPRKIYYLDEGAHIAGCEYNDGSVDIDRFFKQQVLDRRKQDAVYAAKQAEKDARREKYDPLTYRPHGRGGSPSKSSMVLVALTALAIFTLAGIQWLKVYYSSPAWQKAHAPQIRLDPRTIRAQRKQDHDLWERGMANRRDMLRRFPGAQLGPPPPEPPKP